jgi:hypothetical protein
MHIICPVIKTPVYLLPAKWRIAIADLLLYDRQRCVIIQPIMIALRLSQVRQLLTQFCLNKGAHV